MAGFGEDGEGGELFVLPGEAEFEGSSGADAGGGAGVPFVGEGGEELDAVVVGLDEHFGDGGGHAEGAVYLEGASAEGEELGATLLVEIALEDLVGAVAVAEAGPEGHFPGSGEAHTAVASFFEDFSVGFGEFRCAFVPEDSAGVEAVEVGEVAVIFFKGFGVFGPFLE